jgi:hypothetical protein
MIRDMKDGINIGLEDTMDTCTDTLTEKSVDLMNVKDEIEKKIDIREIEFSIPTARKKLDAIVSHVSSETVPSHLATGEHTSVGEIIWD